MTTSKEGSIILSSIKIQILVLRRDTFIKVMKFLNKIVSFYYREYKLNLSGFQDILTNIIFFFISILFLYFLLAQIEKQFLL